MFLVWLFCIAVKFKAVVFQIDFALLLVLWLCLIEVIEVGICLGAKLRFPNCIQSLCLRRYFLLGSSLLPFMYVPLTVERSRR
jgi:hypothetical protein